MNIFVLDKDPKEAAKYHVDKHVVKMITESAQILSTVCRLQGMNCGYKATHKNHPCVKWAAESVSNWLWLVELSYWLSEEYTYRYGKNHKAWEVIKNLSTPDLPNVGLTSFAQAMPEPYRSEDVVKAYRTYYVKDKAHLAKWTKRNIPNWFK